MIATELPLDPASVADGSLSQLLWLCSQLHACSDEELKQQLHHTTEAPSDQHLDALRLLLHSSSYLSQRLSVPRTKPAATHPVPPVVLLSERERAVLTLLAQGRTQPQIGKQLFISPATVNNHCARIREKLKLQGRNALMAFAMKQAG